MLTVLSAASQASRPRCRMSPGADRIVAQLELGDVVLARHDVLDEMIARVARVGGEEDVLVAVADAAEGRDDRGLVAVADVILAAVGAPAVAVRREDHVGRVDVGAVRAARRGRTRRCRRPRAPRRCAARMAGSRSSRSDRGRAPRPARCTSTAGRRSRGSRRTRRCATCPSVRRRRPRPPACTWWRRCGRRFTNSRKSAYQTRL